MIHIILGTKAQLIKMAPLMALMQNQGIAYNYIFTGQHKENIDDICQNFRIKNPDHVLYKGRDITGVTQMLAWSIKLLFNSYKNKKVLFSGDKSGVVLVHGDTLSTLLGALIAKTAGLKVAHIESGLRSFYFFHPFPEEIIRLLTFRLSDYFFAPNQDAVNNLVSYSGITINTGLNTLYDSIQHFRNQTTEIAVDIPTQAFAIASLHRFENIFSVEHLEKVVEIVEHVAKNIKVLFILHKPTEEKLKRFNLYQRLYNNNNIELRPRYDYFNFIKLLSSANFVLSDGGSNQEECYFLGKPIILLRNATERSDGLGKNCLLSKYDISLIDQFIAQIGSYDQPPLVINESPSKIILEHCLPFVETKDTTWKSALVA